MSVVMVFCNDDTVEVDRDLPNAVLLSTDCDGAGSATGATSAAVAE